MPIPNSQRLTRCSAADGRWRGAPSCRVFARGALLALLLPAASLHADVFMRLGRGAQALEQLGGVRLYRADVRVNGQPGKIAVYGFDAAPALLAPDLRKALPMPELGAGAAMAAHVENGQAATLLLLPGSTPRSSVAILIEQTADAYLKSKATPAEWPGGIACPGATLAFTAENLETRTSLAVGTTTDTPEAAASRVQTVLTEGGWSRVPPLTASPGLALYARGNRICAVSASAGGPDGKTRITVLQRLGASP